MEDIPATPAAILQQAAEIGEEAGLQFVYAGNLPGKVGSLEDTLCPKCKHILIRRRGFWVLENHLTSAGNCPDCGQKIPGVWS
jgi:pyruvate formate lyase activating enzyme